MSGSRHIEIIVAKAKESLGQLKGWFSYNRPNRFYRNCHFKEFSCDWSDYVRTSHRRLLKSAAIWAITIVCFARVLSFYFFFSLLRRKTAITEEIKGHEFCSFIEGSHCVVSNAKMIVFRGYSLIPDDRDDRMRAAYRCQSLRSPTIVSVCANDRGDRNDHFRPNLKKDRCGTSILESSYAECKSD